MGKGFRSALSQSINNTCAAQYAEKESDDMEEKKICPFNMKPCMEKMCVLFDVEIGQCEFKDMSRFIGECFNDMEKAVKSMEDTDD